MPVSVGTEVTEPTYAVRLIASVFCTTCMQELHKRQISCPMCRSKITSFLKLSDKDTKGKIQVHEGVPYRISDNEIWGKKIDFLKKHEDATIVIPGKNGWSPGGLKDLGKSLKRKLKKVAKELSLLAQKFLKTRSVNDVSKSAEILKKTVEKYRHCETSY